MKTIYYTLGILILIGALTSCSVDELEIQQPEQNKLNEMIINESTINQSLFMKDSTETNKDDVIDPIITPPKKD